jgi:hypothetical protein
MLFVVVVVEGKLLIAELDVFVLWWKRNERIDSRMEVALGMLMGALVWSAMMSTMGNMVATMVATIELCC